MFRKILFPLDVQEPEFAGKAFAEALRLAESEGAELHLLTVIPGYGLPMVADFFPDDVGPRARSECERLAARFVTDNAAGRTVTITIAEGRPYEEIVRHAEKISADLILMPSHNRRGLHGVLLGSCADNVSRHASCSVLVVRGGGR